ncbi:MAG: glycosyltransferase [Candidatus Lernaella stagnicola]|nr:glycosyltransferase [Candidatus Lernaella stagnicola]
MEQVVVAQVVHSLEVGGMERVASHLAMNMSAAYRPIVVCLTVKGDFAPMLEEAGIEVVALDKQPGRDLTLPRRLARVFADRHVGIVHVHNSGPMFTGTCAGKLAGVKGIVVTDHSRKFPERRSVVITEYVLSRLVNAIVSVSDDNKRDLIEKMLWPARKITVIANGVAPVPEVTAAKRAELREEFGLREDEPVVLTVARLEPQKNLAVLVEAARRVRDRGVAGRFIVAGEGSERPKLEKLIAEYDLADRVTLAGWRLDSLSLYGIASVMALSSDWEGLPMSILEAMSAGLPVVSPGVGDVPKAVVNGENGFLIPPQNPDELAEALAGLLTDANQRAAFGEAGRSVWAARYSVGHMMGEYEAIYERFH